jgi:hypothetical protein
MRSAVLIAVFINEKRNIPRSFLTSLDPMKQIVSIISMGMLWSKGELCHKSFNSKLRHAYLESVGLALGDLVLGDAAVEHVPGELIGVLPVVNQTNKTGNNRKHTVQARVNNSTEQLSKRRD